MNEYRCTPRIGQPMTIFNYSLEGARHVCMMTTYGPPTALFPNNGEGLNIVLVRTNQNPPKQGVYVYVDPKPEKKVNL